MNLQHIINGSKFEHSQQVAKISGLLAGYMGYLDEEIRVITQAAIYHDIGKSSISKEILNKPGALTKAEFEIVKTHTYHGCKQLSEAAEILTIAAMIAHYHHEKLDGKDGYYGLEGDAIHPYVRLVTVADVYDALQAKRAYKSRWDLESIKEYFREQSGRQFDSKIVDLLLDHLDEVQLLYGEGDATDE